MKRLIATLSVMGMFLTTTALADDADDVKAAAHQYYVALNAGDADAYGQLNAAESSIFAAGGGLLSRHLSLEARKQSFQATVDGGLKRNYNQPKHSEVRVYGNMFAIETSYTTGSSTSPSGTITRHRNRATRIWIKQDGQWKIAHQHYSPMQPVHAGELDR